MKIINAGEIFLFRIFLLLHIVEINMCFSFIQEMQAVVNNVKNIVGNLKIVKAILPYR